MGRHPKPFTTPEGFLASISLRISGVRVREHFNYVNTTLQNSGYSAS
jgi:hypothetical protein